MNSDQPPESLIDFDRGRIIKGRAYSMPVGERLRAARYIPQAIVKVTSFATGLKEVRSTVNYISRSGKLPLETESGERIHGKEEQNALLRNWASDFDIRKRSRDTAHIVFSMPKGSDVEALRASVRTVLRKSFPGHEAVFAIHEDQPHPHAHVVVVMRSRLRETKLELKKNDLHELREAFAAAAREHGVEMAASPRAARGVGRKAVRQAFIHMKDEGRTPRAEMEAAQEIMEEIRTGKSKPTPWEEAIARRHRHEKQEYLGLANAFRHKATQAEAEDKAKWLKAATEIETYHKNLPFPQTRRQSIKNKIKSIQKGSRPNKIDLSRENDGLDR